MMIGNNYQRNRQEDFRRVLLNGAGGPGVFFTVKSQAIISWQLRTLLFDMVCLN